MKTFIDFMLEHVNDDGIDGNFARDVKFDTSFPRQRADLKKYYLIILRHLKLMHACPYAIVVFNTYWTDYLAMMGVEA